MCLEKEIKTLIIEALELEDITADDIKDDEPLFIKIGRASCRERV